jgi:hypothetical protein
MQKRRGHLCSRKGKNGVQGLLMAAQSSAPPAENHVLTLLCVFSFMQTMNDMHSAEDGG